MKPFWHIHHEVLLEWSDDIQERIDFIQAEKPKHEVEIRLRLLKPVQGALPPKLVKAGDARDKAYDANAKARDAYDKARDAYVKAGDARDKAKAAYDKAWAAFGKDWDAYVKARAAFGKDWDAFVKASVAYAKAGDAFVKAKAAFVKAKAAYNKAYDECLPQIEALHALECPDCPWNGTTIFPEPSQ